MKSKSKLQYLLKYVIDVIWFGGLLAGLVAIVYNIVFILSVIGIININMPIIDIKMHNHEYRFNSKYIEVRRIDSIIDRYMGVELAQRLYRSTFDTKKGISQLYNFDLEQFEKMFNSERINALVFNQHNLFPARFFAHPEMPQVIIGNSLFLFVMVFFTWIILFNVRKIFNSSIPKNTFTRQNASRLLYIGIYFLLLEAVRLLVYYWINNAVARKEWHNSVQGSYNISFGDINYLILFAGTIFLIISGIFRMSAVIKEENDLTV